MGELKSIGMIGEKGRDVKVKSFLRGIGFWQRAGCKESGEKGGEGEDNGSLHPLPLLVLWAKLIAASQG